MLSMTGKLTKYHFPREKWNAYQAGEVPDWPLIWNMGKVGSQAIVGALRRKGQPAHHIHYLGVMGEFPPDKIAIRETLLRERQREWNIIIPVRDPIARNLSAWYRSRLDYHNFRMPTGVLIEDFLQYPQAWPRSWFHYEPEHFLKYKFLGKPFDTQNGNQVYKFSNPQVSARVLILRTDMLSKLGLILSMFLDLPTEVRIEQENVTAGNQDGGRYKALLEEITLPYQFVRRAYSSQYARTFFSREQLEILTARWTQGT